MIYLHKLVSPRASNVRNYLFARLDEVIPIMKTYTAEGRPKNDKPAKDNSRKIL